MSAFNKGLEMLRSNLTQPSEDQKWIFTTDHKATSKSSNTFQRCLACAAAASSRCCCWTCKPSSCSWCYPPLIKRVNYFEWPPLPLTFYLAFILTVCLKSYLRFYLTCFLTFYQAFYLTFYLTWSLTFHLTCGLTFYLTSCTLSVEVWQCPLRSGARGWGAGGRGEGEGGGEGWGGGGRDAPLIESRDHHLEGGTNPPFLDDFPIGTSIYRDLPLPCLITRG